MERQTHRYDFPDRFVAGTIGQPGQRTFYLQARLGNQITSVVCEKAQVAVLTDHLERILDELAQLVSPEVDIPPAVTEVADLGPLDQPLDEEFRVGTMTLAWDPARDCVAIELFSVVEMTDDGGDPMEQTVDGADFSLLVRLTPEAGRHFIARARQVIASGRPECPFCEQPINPGGHICPRANGYRAPLFGPLDLREFE